MHDNISRREMLKAMGASALALTAGSVLPAGLLKAQDRKAVPDAMFKNPFPVVYEGPDVVIRRINDHLWVGNGHLYSNESIYIYEGTERAVLIDTGTVMDNLDRIVASITTKPLTVLITHQHPDHSGAVKWFPEIWSGPLDEPYEKTFMPDYKGVVHHFTNHQKFDLGGIELEVLFAPGHTPGSVLFVDSANHIGFSGDAFGSGYLLMLTDHSTYADMTDRILDELCERKIYTLFPGHFGGTNHDTTKRIHDLGTIAKDLRDGKIEGEKAEGAGLVNRYVVRDGSRYNYKD